MTTRERREYSSSNVVRTLHPSRPLSPGQQVKVDHNLDYLLDDLQNSVERSRSAATKDGHYLSPSNTSTVVRERSVSPGGGESRRVYKTAHYEYSTSTGANNPVSAGAIDVQQNINSLDSLLQDLKHERERSLERHDTSYSNVGIDDGLLEPSSHVTKTTKTYTTSGGPVSQTGVNRHTTTTVNRELNFDSPINTTTTKTSTLRQSRSRQRSPVAFDTQVTRDVSYDSDPTVDNLNSSNTTTINRSYNTYSSNASSGTQPHHQVVPYNEYVEEVDASTLPAELSGLPMASGILPGPGTKVTTTIKTFTYEIPGDAPAPVNQSYHYKTDTYNSTNNVQQQHIYPPAPAERDIPSPQPGSTTIYKNETYNTINRSHVHPSGPYGPGSHDIPPPRRSVSPGTNTKSVIVKRETHNTSTTSNVHPVPAPYPSGPSGPTNTTYMYKQDIRNTNTTNTMHPHPAHPPPADIGPTAVIYEVSPGAPQPGPKQTYMYKREVTNTKNTVYGPPGGPGGPAQPIVEYPDTLPRSHGPPPHPVPHPAGPTTVVYNYSSTNTNTRNVHGHPDDGSRQPLLPFPVDGQHPSQVDGNPPKRLDDLLATFGDTNGHGPNHRGGIEEPYTPRKEINTALTTGKAEPIVEPKATMKPIAGPPVYYPQGKEMTLKGEQSEAAWRAQGGWAKASGNYEYEAASKSKSSSKSGAAVVPVCLPLCCAMPCSIM